MLNPHSKIEGLYAITPDTQDSAWLLPRVKAVLAGGASMVQYRNKSQDSSLRREQAIAIRTMCREFGAKLIINDDIGLAEAVGAEGVHLGLSDSSVVSARQRLGPHAIIGATCHNQPELAVRALNDGASYVAFGALFPSLSKPEVVSAPLSIFKALPSLGIPRVAIGGINEVNASIAWQAGADMLAVIGGLFYAQSPENAARSILASRG